MVAASACLLAWLLGAATVEAATNVVVRHDSPEVVRQGALEDIDAYLGHRERALRSVGPAAVVFAAPITAAGYYRVYAWWPVAREGVAPRARFTITHRGGTSRVERAQDVLAGQWNTLGVFALDPGARHGVEVATVRGRPMLVDAVRFQYVGATLPALTLETTAVALAEAHTAYRQPLDAVGGVPPYRWQAATPLPDGLSLDPDAGVLAGMPLTPGAYVIRVVVSDSEGTTAAADLDLDVLEGQPSAPQGTRLGETAVPTTEAVAATATPDLSDLLGILASTPEGNWVRVNLNAFSDVWTPAALRPLYGASNPPPLKIIAAWSGFAWDENRGCLWLYGGGHANYSGNDVYFWCGPTRRWERASLPSEIMQDDLGNWNAIDGPDAAPAAAHTYDSNIFLPRLDRFLVLGGAAYNNGGAYLREDTPTTSRRTGPYLFDPSRADGNAVGGTTGSHVKRTAPFPEILGGQMWQNRDSPLHVPGQPSPSSHLKGQTGYAVEDGRDVVYAVARPGSATAVRLYRYEIRDVNDPTADLWEVMGVNTSGPTGQGAGAYDPERRIFLRTTGSSVRPFFYWDLNGVTGLGNVDQAIDFTDPDGRFAAAMGSVPFTYWALDLDPVRRRYLLWSTGGGVWALTPPALMGPTGWSVTPEPAPTGETPASSVGTGVLGKWKYIAGLDAFLALQDSTAGNIWLYKPFGWQPPGTANQPPTVALTAPAPGSQFPSGQAIELVAQASDADGAVALVRFRQGAIVIGEVSEPPYRLTWTPPGPGSYSLSAVAIDDGGASATSAPVVVGVTGNELIVDNGTPGTSFSGVWSVSEAPNPYGSNSLYSSGAGLDVYRWTPSVPVSATYDVYVWWTAHPNRSATVPIAVRHVGGTTTRSFDQRISGGQWVLHGRYAFSAGGLGWVEVSDANGQASADAVRLVPASGPAPPVEVVIDNGAPGTTSTGTWSVSAASTPYGATSLYSNGTGLDTYRWTPTIPQVAQYDVYVWWTVHPNRSQTVPITVKHTGGQQTRTFNQQTGGGQWVLHGRYGFNAGTTGWVEVSDVNGQASADAVRFVPVP